METLKIFADIIEPEALNQIYAMAKSEAYKNNIIRMMPDCHAGKGCTVGTTMQITDKITPNFVGVDIGCFTGDTKIKLADGRELTFIELIDENKSGKENYCFSINDNGEPCITKIESPQLTKYVNELCIITLDNDNVIKCTLDHKFMLRDGTYCEAKNLKINDSLMPLYIDKCVNQSDKLSSVYKGEFMNDYYVIYNPKTNLWDYVHFLSDNYNNNHNLIDYDFPKTWVRHHIDFNKHNNNPTNIKRVGWKEHRKIHQDHFIKLTKEGKIGFLAAEKKHPGLMSRAGHKGMTKNWENPEFRKRHKERIIARNKDINSKYYQYATSEENKKRVGNIGKVFFNKLRTIENNADYQLIIKIKKVLDKVKELNLELNETNWNIARKVFPNKNTMTWNYSVNKLKDYNLTFETIDEWLIKEKEKHIKILKNHKVKDIKIVKVNNEPVYCLINQEFNNFALAAGVFVHNCTVSAHRIKLSKKVNGKQWFDTVKEKLDNVIHENVPSGMNIRKNIDNIPKRTNDRVSQILAELIAPTNIKYSAYSIGTLGGGNHFISVEWCEETNEVYLLIHCGSRHLGVEVCKYWQTKAIQNRTSKKGEVKELINKLKAEGREKEIQSELKKIERPAVSNEMAYLDLNIEPDDFRGYLHDMVICQEFARLNHETITYIIGKYVGIKFDEHIYTTHNYIDTEQMMLRKGAVSAAFGENLIIPMNMRDGSLICVGKGNEDWNYSAPHGAGRIMSRKKAKETLNMEDFKNSMKDVYTTSVNTSTIDEAPMAYKPMESIINAIGDTVDIIKQIKPLYNFKANE